MAKLTIKDRLVAALTARGFREVEGRTRKYLTFTKDGCSFYFVGAAGSLRKGRSVTDSHPADTFKAELLAEAASIENIAKSRPTPSSARRQSWRDRYNAVAGGRP